GTQVHVCVDQGASAVARRHERLHVPEVAHLPQAAIVSPDEASHVRQHAVARRQLREIRVRLLVSLNPRAREAPTALQKADPLSGLGQPARSHCTTEARANHDSIEKIHGSQYSFPSRQRSAEGSIPSQCFVNASISWSMQTTRNGGGFDRLDFDTVWPGGHRGCSSRHLSAPILRGSPTLAPARS